MSLLLTDNIGLETTFHFFLLASIQALTEDDEVNKQHLLHTFQQFSIRYT